MSALPTYKELLLFRHGLLQGVRMFAHWRDGEQWVGTCGTLLRDVEAKIQAGEYDHYYPQELDMEKTSQC